MAWTTCRRDRGGIPTVSSSTGMGSIGSSGSKVQPATESPTLHLADQGVGSTTAGIERVPKAVDFPAQIGDALLLFAVATARQRATRVSGCGHQLQLRNAGIGSVRFCVTEYLLAAQRCLVQPARAVRSHAGSRADLRPGRPDLAGGLHRQPTVAAHPVLQLVP